MIILLKLALRNAILLQKRSERHFAPLSMRATLDGTIAAEYIYTAIFRELHADLMGVVSTESIRLTMESPQKNGSLQPPTITAIITEADSQLPTTSTSESFQLPIIRLVLLGFCVTLGNVALGYGFNAVPVTLDLLADDLAIADKDLQWTMNSYFLAFVRVLPGASYC
jgi:hypothetical protein